MISAYPYKSYQVNKYNKLGVQLKSLQYNVDSLKQFELEKSAAQRRFNNYFYFNGFESACTPRMWKMLCKIAKADSMSYHWNHSFTDSFKNHLVRLGYNNPKELESFILENIINKDDSDRSILAEKKNTEVLDIREKRSIVNRHIYASKEISEQSISFFYILLMAIFALRYLYYAVKWSLYTLKQK